MSDTLAIAVSQSGTTTDTNRTVDLLRGRGAAVLAIVNRRSSDLTDKADGVLYTSDGRDVEMSVASTKAFYAQVAAGTLLACAVSEAAGVGTPQRRHELLDRAAARCPTRCARCWRGATVVAEAARRFAPTKRYWAVVGSGANKVAAEEVRIKLSELCYKSIACDVIEDKKHIDLSSEPMILVCAAGLAGSAADDVGKEIAIFRAHKATPIVIADDGDDRYAGATVIAGAVGRPGARVRAVGDGRSPLRLRGGAGDRRVGAPAPRGHGGRRAGRRRRDLGRRRAGGGAAWGSPARWPSTATACGPTATTATSRRAPRCSWPGCCATCARTARSRPTRRAPARSARRPPSSTTSVLALTRAIDELTRPVDAIKHQAKTVTVGISRSDEGVMDRALVQAVLDAGAGRDVLSYRTLKVLADLDPAVAEISGFTRYGIDGDTITVVDRGGISQQIAEPRRPQPGARRHQAARRQRARGARRPRPQRRTHHHHGAGGQGRVRRPASRCCRSASTTASTRRRCAACSSATTAATTASWTG